jgi:hypothetical protein
LTGSTDGAGDDFDTTCGASGAADLAYLWTAPASGCYRFDTEGSDFDTTLSIMAYTREPTCAPEDVIDCDDDSGESTTSAIDYYATADEAVMIVIDGYRSGDDGDFDLNIGLCPDP